MPAPHCTTKQPALNDNPPSSLPIMIHCCGRVCAVVLRSDRVQASGLRPRLGDGAIRRHPARAATHPLEPSAVPDNAVANPAPRAPPHHTAHHTTPHARAHAWGGVLYVCIVSCAPCMLHRLRVNMQVLCSICCARSFFRLPFPLTPHMRALSNPIQAAESMQGWGNAVELNKTASD